MPSYFNKPSWASRGNGDEGTDFYRRAGQTYRDIVATDINARQRRAHSPESNSRKRQRLSNQSDDRDAQGSNAEQEAENETNAQPEDSPALKYVPHKSDTHFDCSTRLQVSQASKRSTVEAHELMTSTLQDSQKRILSDPQAAQADITSTSYPEKISYETADSSVKGLLEDTRTPTDTGTPRTDRNTAYDNTVVQIFITSEMADTKPLIIHRKMSQPLKDVRLAWCERQNLPKEVASTVFLTWKGKRLFDVTTCRSLNIEAHSAFTRELSLFDDCIGDTDGHRVHMEAVTEEMFAAGYQSSPKMADSDSNSPTLAKSQAVEPQAQHEITLKCPGLDDFKIRVSPTTRVFQVLDALRKSRRISSELDVYLAFDGDRLDPHSCLADHEIDDGDMVEVIIKKAMRLAP
ncbi:ubiquitin-2 like Rad60 SUMO-like-domain-containing protein [Aspergillus undulatus]|uniref:ubiquitin-2 like Rad60 SUMO-like-domain-containing protein n=1 Tax=Aspergillus undulatus TaxID=1810928 RepID=UPI003CCDFB85